MTWSAVTDAAGYKVYVRQEGQSFGSGIDAGSVAPDGTGQIAYLVAGLPMNVPNYFAVSSYDTVGSESDLSNVLSLMLMATPTPSVLSDSPPTPTPTTGAVVSATASPIVNSPTPTAFDSPTPTVTPANGTPGLVAAYSFDEGQGATVYDSSGLGNHGVMGAPVTRTTNARHGSGALSFPGSTGSYVSVPDAASLALSSGLTFEAWVLPTQLDGKLRLILAKEMVDPFNYTAWALYGPGWDTKNKPSGLFLDAGTNDWFACRGWTDLTLNAWNHVALTYDQGSGTETVYLNGNPDNTCAQGTHDIKNSNQPLRIGGLSLWDASFIGAIDDVRIWNYARSAADIITDRDTPVSAPVLVASNTPAPTNTSTSSPTRSTTPTPSDTATRTFTPTVTATRTATSSFTATRTPTFTATATPSYTKSSSITPTSTATQTATPTTTQTRTPSASPTLTASATSTATRTDTRTPTSTYTLPPSATPTSTRTDTSTGTPTSTRTQTNTTTATATRTAHATATPTPTSTRMSSVTPTRTSTASYTATVTMTISPTRTASSTATVTASFTHTPTETFTRTAVPSASATPTRSQTHTLTSTATPTNTSTSTAHATETNTPSPALPSTPTWTRTETSTALPSSTPVFTSTATPTPTVTEADTATATPTVTVSASSTVTATETHSPTVTPTATATATSTFTPTTTSTSVASATETPTTSPTTTNTPLQETATPTHTATLSATAVPPTPSLSPTASDTPTDTPTSAPPTPTLTDTAAPTASATETKVWTETPIPTPSATSTPSSTPTTTPSTTATETAPPATAPETATTVPTDSPTVLSPEDTSTSTPAPIVSPTAPVDPVDAANTPTEQPSSTATPVPTETPTVRFPASPTPTDSVTATATANPSAIPTATETPPAPTPTPTSTVSDTPQPTAAPTASRYGRPLAIAYQTHGDYGVSVHYLGAPASVVSIPSSMRDQRQVLSRGLLTSAAVAAGAPLVAIGDLLGDGTDSLIVAQNGTDPRLPADLVQVYRISASAPPRALGDFRAFGNSRTSSAGNLIVGDVDPDVPGDEIIVAEDGVSTHPSAEVRVFGGAGSGRVHLLTNFRVQRARDNTGPPIAMALGNVTADRSGQQLIIGDARGCVSVYDVQQGVVSRRRRLTAFPDRPGTSAHQLAAGDLIPRNPGDEVVVADDGTWQDGLVRIFDVDSGRMLLEFEPFDVHAPNGLEVSVGDVLAGLDGAELLVSQGASGGTIRIFNLSQSIPMHVLDVDDPLHRTTSFKQQLAIGDLMPGMPGKELAVAQADPHVPVQVFHMDAGTATAIDKLSEPPDEAAANIAAGR